MPIPKKLYPCFGYEITIDEAAEFCSVSVASIRARLTELGGSMEAVLQLYDKKYGGVIARMEGYKDAEDDVKTRQTVDDIMTALGMAEEAETESDAGEAESPAVEAERGFNPENAENIGVMIHRGGIAEIEPVDEAAEFPGMMLEELRPDHTEEKRQLSLLNAAITAIEKLEDVDFVLECASVLRDDFLMKLKQMRINEFEHLVDWAAIAAGKDK